MKIKEEEAVKLLKRLGYSVHKPLEVKVLLSKGRVATLSPKGIEIAMGGLGVFLLDWDEFDTLSIATEEFEEMEAS